MLDRYCTPEMKHLWSDENRYAIWLAIECHAADALAQHGAIPAESARAIRDRAAFSVPRIEELESVVRHDMIAFLTNVAENVGSEARFLHQGMTSSDVYDTCLAVQLVRAGELIDCSLRRLENALNGRAHQYKYTPTIGRSHGVHAEPTTFGLKLAQAFAEIQRGRVRLAEAVNEISTCAISGAVGTFANVDPSVEIYVAQALGLKVELISTQVIPRDRHAAYFCTLGLIAASLERIATEIRHLQRTEVLEVEEPFAEGQKGSSAMPHKRNPVLCENVTGLARVVRAYVAPSLENVVLWHERDISHSSVERYMGPDVTATIEFATHRLADVIDGLQVYEDNMRSNLDAFGGIVHSQQVMLALTQVGVAREDAYKMVQRHAMAAWLARPRQSFRELVFSDTQITDALGDARLAACFDLDYHLKHVDFLFDRVFSGPMK